MGKHSIQDSSTFTGKEIDEETGYGYFGARYMDHELMTMWLSVDPMAGKYPSISPYAYCAWNPVKLVDPDGRKIWIYNYDGKGTNLRFEPGKTRPMGTKAAQEQIRSLNRMAQTDAGWKLIYRMDKLKDNIVYQVINTERNEDLLKVIPHRNIGDLSVIYRGVVSSDESGISTYVVNNSFAKQFNLSEEQLYSIASKNMHNRYPATFEPLSNVISRIIGVKEMFNPEWDMNGDSKVPENELVLLRCGEQMWGASAILDNDAMDKVCNALDVDQVYVLPSSIYEVLICAANQYKDPEALAEMVQEINRNEVSETDFLSDNVYLYDKNERRLTIANDVNKAMEIKRDNEIGITH